MRGVVILVITLLFSGCAVKNVKVWDKSLLAKESMSEKGINSNLKSFEEHIYFSKEGTRISSSIVGGGCGCN